MTTNKVNKQKLYKLIPPLTSWMKLIKKNVEDLNLEDRKKYDRLEILSSLTGIECNIPIYKLKTTDVLSNKINIKFKGRCGWRLIPSKNNFPKLRTRGKSMSVNKKWLIEEKINPNIYPLIEIIPQHKQIINSGIFIIDDHKIFGEVVPGDLWQLIYGTTPTNLSIHFIYDFKKWTFSKKNTSVEKIVKKLVKQLKIENFGIKKEVKNKLNGELTNFGFIKGYYEFRALKDRIMLVDYDRILYKLFNNHLLTNKLYLKGTCISLGRCTGKIKIINNPKNQTISKNDIIVCPIITVDYLPLIRKCAGVIIKQGGMLSHAAIILREIKKPCLALPNEIIKKLKNNDKVIIDAYTDQIIINNT